jgi:hypothetical protein
MNTQDLSRVGTLAGLGLLSGLAGTLVMTLGQKAEMRLTKREPSEVPAEAVETITNTPAPDARQQAQLSTAAHVAFGTSLGLGLVALSKLPEPARGVAFFAGAWGAGTALITGLGLADRPTQWGAQKLAIDLGHHAVYAASAAASFAGLRRLAHV